MPLPYINIPDGHVGRLPIHPFGVLVATGVLIGSALAVRRAERFGIPKQRFETFITFILAFGFVLSHMLDEVMYRPHEVLEHPLQLFKIWAGISSYGGFIGGLVGAVVWKYTEHPEGLRLTWFGSLRAAFTWRLAKEPRPILPFIDHIAAVFPISWIFGRAGCSVAHDHIGRASHSFLAVNFPGGPRFDLGLMELMCTIPIAIATFVYASKPRPTGAIVGFLAVLYAPVRFVLDSMRATDIMNADARYFGMTPGQWLSVLLLVVGTTLLLRARKLPKVGPLPPPALTAPTSEDPSETAAKP